MRRRAPAIGLLAVLALAGCGGSESSTAPALVSTPPPTHATTTATATAIATPTASATAAGTATPDGTVLAFFDAINRKDWRTVWALGGSRLSPSFSAMVRGYAGLASDDVFIVANDANRVRVKVLATTTAGAAQLYDGTYTVTNGEITAGVLRLEQADRGEGFSALAGTWRGHGRAVTITPGGLGVLQYRTYQWCDEQPGPACDGFQGDLLVDGGLTTFRLTGITGTDAHGAFLTSNTGLAGPMTATVHPTDATLLVTGFPSFCSDRSPVGACGA